MNWRFLLVGMLSVGLCMPMLSLRAETVACERDIAAIAQAAATDVESRVVRLADLARYRSQASDLDCSLRAIEQAGVLIRAHPDQSLRAGAYFDTKDVALAVLEQHPLLAEPTRDRLVVAVLGSFDERWQPVTSAGQDERVNDTHFLFKLARYFETKDDQSYAHRLYRYSLVLNRTLPEGSARLQWIDMLNLLQSRIKASQFLEVAELLEQIPASERAKSYNRLVKQVRYHRDVAHYRIQFYKGRSPQQVRRDIEGMKRLYPILFDMGVTSKRKVDQSWPLYPYLFIAAGYRVLGESQQSGKWLDKAIAAARTESLPERRAKAIFLIGIELSLPRIVPSSRSNCMTKRKRFT